MNGKGDRNRTSNWDSYRDNYDEIEWGEDMENEYDVGQYIQNLEAGIEEKEAEIERLREALIKIASVDEWLICGCYEDCSCGMREAIYIAEKALEKDDE